jgi:hypothetical protein
LGHLKKADTQGCDIVFPLRALAAKNLWQLPNLARSAAAKKADIQAIRRKN